MNNLPKVQKKNKTNKVSPFWAFAIEFKENMKKRGNIIHNDHQLKEMASPHWNKLTEEQRDKYKQKAKTFEPTVNKKRKLYNSLGQDLEEVDAEKKRKRDNMIVMQEDIKQLLEDANNVGDLDDLVLYFINTTSFYDSTDGTFPAELAIAKFSLKQGIIDDIQIRINPGKLPKGAPDTALKNAEKHKYDLPTDNDVEPDYMVILETMIKFLHPMDKLPIFFTEGNMRDKKIELEETRRVVAKIFYESEEDGMEVKIYPIDELFFTLQKITTANKNRLNETKNPPFSSIAFAADKFNKFNDFFYSSRGCDFHREKDAEPECCLSIVRRYGYTIAKWCSDGNRYELHEGKHFPEGYKHED